jgi:hypothetical protein
VEYIEDAPNRQGLTWEADPTITFARGSPPPSSCGCCAGSSTGTRDTRAGGAGWRPRSTAGNTAPAPPAATPTPVAGEGHGLKSGLQLGLTKATGWGSGSPRVTSSRIGAGACGAGVKQIGEVMIKKLLPRVFYCRNLDSKQSLSCSFRSHGEAYIFTLAL